MLKSNGLSVIEIKSLGVDVHSIYSYGNLVWTKIVPITYSITLSAASSTIGAQGGSISLTVVGTKTSTTPLGTITESFTPNLEITGTGFSLNGNILEIENRGTIIGGIRSCTITASYPEATTKTLVISQSENQIEGTFNGVVLTSPKGSTQETALEAFGESVTLVSSAGAYTSYSSGATSGTGGTPTLVLTPSTGFTLSGNILTVEDRNLTLGALRSCIITASYPEMDDITLTLYQKENAILSDAITLNCTPSTFTGLGGVGILSLNSHRVYTSNREVDVDLTPQTIFSEDTSWTSIVNTHEVLVAGRQTDPGMQRTTLITGTYNSTAYTKQITQEAYATSCILTGTPIWSSTVMGEVTITFSANNYRAQDVTITIHYTDTHGTSGFTSSVIFEEEVTGVGDNPTITLSDCGRIDSLTVSPASDTEYLYTTLLLSPTVYISYAPTTVAPGEVVIIKSSLPWTLVAVSPTDLFPDVSSGGGYVAFSTEVTFNNTTHSSQIAIITWASGETSNITVTGHPVSNLKVSYNNIDYIAGDGRSAIIPSGDSISVYSLEPWTSELIEGTGTLTPSSGSAGTTSVTVVGTGSVGSYKAVFSITSSVIDVIGILVSESVNQTLYASAGSTPQNPLPASGGTSIITWTGATTPVLSIPVTEGFTLLDNVITAEDRGTIPGTLRSVVVTAVTDGLPDRTITIYQQANAVEDFSIEISASPLNYQALGGVGEVTVESVEIYTSGHTTTATDITSSVSLSSQSWVHFL